MSYLFRNQGDHVFDMRNHWIIDNPVRRWIHPPDKLLGGFVRPGMTVIDSGCGTGLFTLAMARMVGPSGRVVAVDIQPEALAMVAKKAEQACLHSIVETWKCEADDIGALPACDFALAFNMVHETPDIDHYFSRMSQCLRSGSALLLIEPLFHVRQGHFDRELAAAAKAGLSLEQRPAVRMSHAAILRKG